MVKGPGSLWNKTNRVQLCSHMQSGFHLIIMEFQNSNMGKVTELLSKPLSPKHYPNQCTSFKVLSVYHVQGPVPGVSAEGSTVRLCLRGGLFSLGRGKVKSLWAQRTERSHQPEGMPDPCFPAVLTNILEFLWMFFGGHQGSWRAPRPKGWILGSRPAVTKTIPSLFMS